jgi:glycosyltransferase involved in cell wall biosynthesis
VDHGLAWYARFLGTAARLITVHDLIPLLIMNGKLEMAPIPRKRVPILRESMRQIRAADHLVAVSSNTADCLRRELDIPANRITVIHNFVDPEFRPLLAPELALVRRKFFGDAEHAVIHVGKHSAYKNRIGSLRAFARVLREVPGARMFLVHGAPDPEEAAFLKEAGCEYAVRFLGALSLPELRRFYGAADVLIFPSIYEGFGWPPVEAMACGCPVVSTPCGSLGEVVADAALVVADPHNHAGLADAAISVLRDAALRRELRERGFKNAERFRPYRMLEHATEVYRRMLN